MIRGTCVSRTEGSPALLLRTIISIQLLKVVMLWNCKRFPKDFIAVFNILNIDSSETGFSKTRYIYDRATITVSYKGTSVSYSSHFCFVLFFLFACLSPAITYSIILIWFLIICSLWIYPALYVIDIPIWWLWIISRCLKGIPNAPHLVCGNVAFSEIKKLPKSFLSKPCLNCVI